MGKYIVISTTVDLVRIAPESVVYICSDGNYSTLIQADGLNRILTVQLGQLETLIAKQLGTEGNVFIRIGKSLIYLLYQYPEAAARPLRCQDCQSPGYGIQGRAASA